MLDQMRNSSQSLIIWVLFAIIIAAFVLFFGSPSDSLGCGSTNDYSIEVDSEPVSVHSWRFTYNGMPLLYGNMPGNQRRPQALEFLLQREILAQAAEKLDFQVSKELLDDSIKYGDFYLMGNKVDGTRFYFEDSEEEGFFFNFEYLENLVKGRLGLPSMTTYRAEQRREMLAYLMKQELMQGSYVSEEEARETFVASNTTVSANYVKFEVSKYRAGLKLSEAEVQKYADSHEEELAKEWENVKLRWEGDKARVRARIIKITKTPPTAEDNAGSSPEVKADPAKASAEAALVRIQGGESFAAVASDLSEDRTASLGGHIGWRAAESMGYGQEVVEASKELKVGTVSSVIDSSMYYYLVLIEERSDKGLTLAQKKFDLATKAAPEETARARAKAAAELALAQTATTPLSELFKTAAPRGGFDLNSLPPEIRNQLTPEQRENLMNSAMPGSESGALVVEGRTRLAQAGGVVEVPAAPIAKPAVVTPAVAKPATAKPVTVATPVVAKPATVATPVVAKPAVKKPATTPVATVTATPAVVGEQAVVSSIAAPALETFSGATRNGDFIVGLGRSKELVADVFGELAINSMSAKVYEVRESDGFVILQLTDRTEADMERFKEEAAALQASLAESKGIDRLQSWLLESCLNLKKSGAIKPNYSLLVTGSDSKQIPYEPCSSLGPR